MTEGGKPDRALAIVLILVGLLILALSGTCSASFLAGGGFYIPGPAGAPRPSVWTRLILPFLIFGAPFLALGAATLFVGLRPRGKGSQIPAMIVGMIYLAVGLLGLVYFGFLLIDQPSFTMAFVVGIFAAIGWLGWRTAPWP